MMAFRMEETTPCGAMFDAFKRHCGISHKQLAGFILSDRPLSDGRSAASRASDRTWLSHFVVHAPVGLLQPAYFCDWGMAAQRVLGRLRSYGTRSMTFEKIIDFASRASYESMSVALAACRQDEGLYRNALERFVHGQGHTTGERAEALMVLFLAVGCSANLRVAIEYANRYAEKSLGGRMGTLESAEVAGRDDAAGSGEGADVARRLGLMRVRDGYLSGAMHWIDAAGAGAVIGAMALGAEDICDVEADVSAGHARVRWDAERACWTACDLGSTNGTVLVSGADGERARLEPGEPAELYPGDEIALGASTIFVAME